MRFRCAVLVAFVLATSGQAQPLPSGAVARFGTPPSEPIDHLRVVAHGEQ
jgi:hypothetical protein